MRTKSRPRTYNAVLHAMATRRLQQFVVPEALRPMLTLRTFTDALALAWEVLLGSADRPLVSVDEIDQIVRNVRALPGGAVKAEMLHQIRILADIRQSRMRNRALFDRLLDDALSESKN